MNHGSRPAFDSIPTQTADPTPGPTAAAAPMASSVPPQSQRPSESRVSTESAIGSPAPSPSLALSPAAASTPRTAPYDLLGVGLGPFNLSLAALAEPVPALRALFLEAKPRFSWHPGMMVEGATLQVPFLADLVTLVDPTSRHSYLAHLRDIGRLFSFYFAEQFHVPRIEYEAYCAAVSRSLASCRFSSRVTEVRPTTLPDGRDGFAVSFEESHGRHEARTLSDQSRHTLATANLVLGIGTEPCVPAALRPLRDQAPTSVTHSADYLAHASWIRAADDVTVVGSGQSGAEIVLDLLRGWHRPGRRLRWLTRSAAFEPMEYSKLGLEHFTPDYMDHFHALPEGSRDALLVGQGRLYKAVSDETLAAIRSELDARAFPAGAAATGVTLMPGVEVLSGQRDGDLVDLTLRHSQTRRRFGLKTQRLILATGYTPRSPDCLAPIEALIERDDHGRPVIGRDHRVRLAGTQAGLYVQNAELHTHGVGTPDLGLGAYRAAAILNSVTGRAVYPLPSRTAHTAFTPDTAAAADPGITLTIQEPGHGHSGHGHASPAKTGPAQSGSTLSGPAQPGPAQSGSPQSGAGHAHAGQPGHAGGGQHRQPVGPRHAQGRADGAGTSEPGPFEPAAPDFGLGELDPTTPAHRG